MDIKSAPFTVKAAGPDDGLTEGQFVGYASAFGNEDSYGDVVQPGAFTKTLDEWSEKGAQIPVLWGHDMNDPFANIGGVVKAEEDESGLKVTAQLDMDNPTAVQVYRLLKGRRIDTMSFSYSIRDSEKKGGQTHLKDLKVYEVSVVHVPANDQAQVLAVKSAAGALAKAGRTISAKNESALREARDSIDSVLSSLAVEEDGKSTPKGGNDQEKQASGEAEAKSGASDEEPAGAKSPAPDEEPEAESSVDSTLAAKFNLYATAYVGKES